MKRVILFVLCFALMAPCAWAVNKPSAVYTHDDMTIGVGETSPNFQIEAMRDVKFIYTPTKDDTAESYTIAFTNGVSMDMTSADGKFSCLYSFDTALAGTEIGISMDAPGFTRCSADITEPLLIELEKPSLSLKTSEQTIIYFDEKGKNKVTEFDVDDTKCPRTFASFVYDDGISLKRSPRIMVTAGTSEETKVIPIPFTRKTDGKSFMRQCTITITNGNSTGGGGSSGGGCNAGLAGLGLGLLALLPFAVRRKR